MTQEVHLGSGACRRLDALLDRWTARSVLLVADPRAYGASGVAESWSQTLGRRRVETWTCVDGPPDLPATEAIVARLRKRPVDAVLAVGGGAAIDLAKLARRFAPGSLSVKQQLRRETPPNVERRVPFAAIPTTAGSGSEATRFAVLYVNGRKRSVAGDDLLPDAALVDSDLTQSLPHGAAAAAALDALCQGVESFWCVRADEVSRAWSAEAIALAWSNVTRFVRDRDAESREAMSRASHLAGKAINRAPTTAPHAVSYHLTSRYGVPHGMAVAMTLGAFLEFNALASDDDCLDPRGPVAVRANVARIVDLLQCDSAAQARLRIQACAASLGAPVRLEQAGVASASQLARLAASVDPQRLANNPRRISRAGLAELLFRIH